MSEWDCVAKHQPVDEPLGIEQTYRAVLERRFVPYWINSVGEAKPLSTRGFHLRKSCLTTIRRHMQDGSSSEMNHHTRYYVRDLSLPWNPSSPYCWMPVAERPRDQWVPEY